MNSSLCNGDLKEMSVCLCGVHLDLDAAVIALAHNVIGIPQYRYFVLLKPTAQCRENFVSLQCTTAQHGQICSTASPHASHSQCGSAHTYNTYETQQGPAKTGSPLILVPHDWHGPAGGRVVARGCAQLRHSRLPLAFCADSDAAQGLAKAAAQHLA